jgi:acyl-CoA reductase-like NAD-dependent aldehyde dehydrogenase
MSRIASLDVAAPEFSALERIGRARTVQPAWGALGPAKRARVLGQLRRAISLNCDRIVAAVSADTGKPALDALGGDVLATLEQMLFYERHAQPILSPRRIRRSRLFYPGSRFREYFEPHGVVLIFGPANYPFQLSLVPAITALYAGNAVVLKVSERTPSTAGVIRALVREAELPVDLLQVASDEPAQATALIDARPDFIFFTGRGANGRQVAAQAGALGIPTLLELGGSDPALVFADCNFERTIEGVVYGAFSNAGQVCVGIKRLYIESRIYDRFLSELSRRTAQLRVGSGYESDLGLIADASSARTLDAQIQDALDLGARLETASPASGGDLPAILSNVPANASLLREEAFGPVLCVQPFSTEAEAIELANSTPFALGASIWTRDLERGRRVSLALSAANISVNDVIRNIANPHAAFGGNGASGYGRYHGAHGLRAFSRTKTVMQTRASRGREVNWFPFTRKTYDSLHAIIRLRNRPQGWIAALRGFMHLAIVALVLTHASTSAAGFAHLVLQVGVASGEHGALGRVVFCSPHDSAQHPMSADTLSISALPVVPA